MKRAMKEDRSSFLQNIIHQFYENGQRDPETVIEALRDACSDHLDVFRFSSGAGVPAESIQTMVPERWIAAWTDKTLLKDILVTPDPMPVIPIPLSAISLPELLQEAKKTPFCPGVLLNPGAEPVFLSMDIIDLIVEEGEAVNGLPVSCESERDLPESGFPESGTAEHSLSEYDASISDASEHDLLVSGASEHSLPESDPSASEFLSEPAMIPDVARRIESGIFSAEKSSDIPEYSLEFIEDLIRQGDHYHDPDGEYDIHKAYECYKRAYDLACLEKDLYVYPEVCLRLAEHYPERYSHKELLALLDETILYFGIRVNAGDETAPALMIRAQRVREQATIRQARKMVIRRYIV